MATTFKQFLNNDVTTTRTLLHENIPITGSIVSGTYNQGSSTTETNIKNYSHGLFQSGFDYPFLISSACRFISCLHISPVVTFLPACLE